MSDSLIEASDGLPARRSGEWAQEKLFYVSRYMDIFSKGQKNKWPLRAYVDLMAGPGLCKLGRGGAEFPGSPLLSLSVAHPFTHAVFVELHAGAATALETRSRAAGLRPPPTVIRGDCNDAAVLEQIARAVPPNALTLAFVDMLGLDVAFATIETLTRGRHVDLAITFQIQDLVRNIKTAVAAGRDARLDGFFGTSAWIDHGRDLNPGPRAEALTRFYLTRLRTLGYVCGVQLHVLMKNSKQAPLYRLMLASRHPRAIDYFRKISMIEYSGQRGLFS